MTKFFPYEKKLKRNLEKKGDTIKMYKITCNMEKVVREIIFSTQNARTRARWNVRLEKKWVEGMVAVALRFSMEESAYSTERLKTRNCTILNGGGEEGKGSR